MSQSSTCEQPSLSIDEFKNTVREWLMIEEDISNTQRVVREKRKRMQKLSEYISIFMKQNDKEFCDVGNEQALVLKKRKTTGGLKKEYIIQVLSEIVKDEQKAKEYTEKMYSMRTIKETDVIKKTTI